MEGCMCDRHGRWRAADVAEAAGITYRQLDYWLRIGLVTSVAEERPGSGGRRQFTRREVLLTACVARVMAFTADSAIARKLWDHLDSMGDVDEWPDAVVVDSQGVYRPGKSRRDGLYIAVASAIAPILAATRSANRCSLAPTG